MRENDAEIATPRTVAEWMAAQIEEYGELRQPEAALAIQQQFGEEFVYDDGFGHLGISRKVLYQFRKIAADFIVWEVLYCDYFNGRWRLRNSGDKLCRTQLR